MTLGQYLRPTRDHRPVARYVPPADFERWADHARALGFAGVYSGVFVRSSFNAEEVFHGAAGRAVAGRRSRLSGREGLAALSGLLLALSFPKYGHWRGGLGRPSRRSWSRWPKRRVAACASASAT